MGYLIKLILQILLYLVIPFGRLAYLAFHDRAFLKQIHVRFCFTTFMLTLSALVIISVYTDFFPSLLALIIGIVLNIKFSSPLYRKLSRMARD